MIGLASLVTKREAGTGAGLGKKPTREEFSERVLFTLRLLSRSLYKSEIKRVLKSKYHVNARTIETYLARARRLLIKQTRKPKERHFAESYAFYLDILRDPGAERKEKDWARERLDWLLGLVSFKIEHSGSVKSVKEHNVLVRIAEYQEAFDRVANPIKDGGRPAGDGSGKPVDPARTAREASSVSRP